MRRNLLMIFGTFSLLIILIIWSCKKESNNSAAIDSALYGTNSVERSSVEALNTFEDLNGLADVGMGSTNLKSLDLDLGNCPGISLNLVKQPFSIMLDWGSGCSSNNVKRSGRITITLSGAMNSENNVATFTFADFVTDGKKISGVHRITYKGLNSTNWPQYLIFTEAKISYSDNTFETYRAEIWRRQAAGKETLSVLDDVWRMEGTSSGIAKDGSKWTAKSASALVKKGACKWISSGKWVITPEKGDVSTIDFGNDGTCDDKATIKVGDKITEIKL
jgi:hypothetical protein